MSPKRFHRICRLHRALSLALPAPAEPGRWSRAAATAGYADHAHLVRDCRALLGEPPSAFAARGRA
jgi:AraC-like DNA-binding protein